MVFNWTILIIFYKQIEEYLETLTAEMFKLQALCAYRTLVDAWKSFEKLSSPLIDVLEGNVSLERMYNGLDKIYTFLWIGNRWVKYLALPYFAELIVFIGNIIDILLHCLQLLWSYCQPRAIDWTPNKLD